MVARVVQYDPSKDSEYRRQTNPNLRAQQGTGQKVQQQVVQTVPESQTAIDRAENILRNIQIPNISSLFGNLGGLGTSKGPSASDILASRKYEDELAKERRTIQAYQQLLGGTGYRAGADQLIGLIEAQSGKTRGNVEKAYEDALKNIAAGYGQAESLAKTGYRDLQTYLEQNPNNPYAGMRAQVGAAPDALEQILSAYGVSAEPVRAQVAAEQAAAQQGAAGFQNLLDVLGGAAAQADLSRLAEMQMGQRLAAETLTGQRATFQSQAERARADALAQIEAQLAQARLDAESAAIARRQQIEDAIAAAGGAIPETGATNPSRETSGETEEEKRRREALAALASAGMPPVAAQQIIEQNIGNPLVAGGIPDYMRVMAEQMARR